MTDFSEISAYSQHKTRVLIYSSYPKTAKLVLHVLDFFGKNTDFILANGKSKTADCDFVILETSDLQKAADFKANIGLISDEMGSGNLTSILKNITAGGILVYPENMEETVDEAENYFRKLSFSNAEFKTEGEKILISTEMGEIPLASGDANLVKNINGIKLLCQQFGIMEEDFYEAMMSFD